MFRQCCFVSVDIMMCTRYAPKFSIVTRHSSHGAAVNRGFHRTACVMMLLRAHGVGLR